MLFRSLSSYFYGPVHDHASIEISYEGDRKYHINKDSYLYGAVLVQMKRIKVGYTLKINGSWRRWLWKPDFGSKYSRHFHWLCFYTWLEPEYEKVPDKVLKDHLRESLA